MTVGGPLLPFLNRLAVVPRCLVQGLVARRRVARLPEPPGPRRGVQGAGQPLRLLILGDSAAAGVGAAAQSQALAGQLVTMLATTHTVTWRLEAESGATARTAMGRLAALGPLPLDAAVVVLGVNDVARQVPIHLWLRRMRALTTHLAGSHRARRIYLSAVPPMGLFPALPEPLRGLLGARAARFDAGLAELAQELGDAGARHLPFAPAELRPELMAVDGFHPGPAQYRLWGERIANRIRADFAPAA